MPPPSVYSSVRFLGVEILVGAVWRYVANTTITKVLDC